jgi:SAM-dependent methyltransferase
MVQVMDYDAGGYDYRTFWHGRDFEHRTETRLLERLLGEAGPVDWFVDLGGGFGRNVPVYQRFARHVVLVDYSLTNLRAAARTLVPGDGRLELVRADVYRLPFRDNAFDGAACIRLLHHLTDLDAALAEMSRVVDGRWILDVPIRHHLLARLRALRGGAPDGADPREPLLLGSPECPYWNFHLGQVRDTLGELGLRTEVAASVHNLRRWERAVAGPRSRAAAMPVMRLLESFLQRAGRGWWGPSQFLTASPAQAPATTPATTRATAPATAPAPARAAGFLDLLACPDCRGRLVLGLDGGSGEATACCRECGAGFAREGGIWDFTRAIARPSCAAGARRPV